MSKPRRLHPVTPPRIVPFPRFTPASSIVITKPLMLRHMDNMQILALEKPRLARALIQAAEISARRPKTNAGP